MASTYPLVANQNTAPYPPEAPEANEADQARARELLAEVHGLNVSRVVERAPAPEHTSLRLRLNVRGA